MAGHRCCLVVVMLQAGDSVGEWASQLAAASETSSSCNGHSPLSLQHAARVSLAKTLSPTMVRVQVGGVWNMVFAGVQGESLVVIAV